MEDRHRDPTGRGRAPGDPGPAAHPNAPSGLAVFLAFAGVLVAGALGGIIGWGIADAACTGSCGLLLLGGAVAGAVVAATGAGVVAVLLLRSVSEWRSHDPT